MGNLNRRQLITTAARLTLAATFAGVPLARLAASTAPPFPTLGGGRVVPRPLDDYDRARLSGGPGKDGIPSIDAPRFWSPEEADRYLNGDDIVFGLVEGGVIRAYPQRILVWHEIVNDTVGGRPLAVTYCPLTGTAIVFERGSAEFGVSGQLVNSNLIMYDRSTDTWFPQMLAVGIEGPHMGASLVERPIIWTTWQRWRSAHPDTTVLSTDTGFARNYFRDPYGAYNPVSGYYTPASEPIFPLMHRDSRYPAKTMFVAARTETASVAFRLDSLRDAGRLELETGGETFIAQYDDAFDTGRILRAAGGPVPEPLNSYQAMWFAWAAFYPETAVHG